MWNILTPYGDTFEPPLLPISAPIGHHVPCIPSVLQQRDVIDFMLDDEIVASSHGGGYWQFLVKWKD